MEKLKLFVDEAVKLDDIVLPSRSKLEPDIIEVAKTLKPGYGKPVNTDGVKPNVFINRVWIMTNEGRLPKDITVRRPRGTGKVFLYKMTPEELEARQERRGSK